MAERTLRKVRTGHVISHSGDKSAVVELERLVKHPMYGKYIRRRKKLHVHDEKNECQVGDLVRVMETRPVSKMKHWRLIEILQKAK